MIIEREKLEGNHHEEDLKRSKKYNVGRQNKLKESWRKGANNCTELLSVTLAFHLLRSVLLYHIASSLC